jgi:hypothetical protein
MSRGGCLKDYRVCVVEARAPNECRSEVAAAEGADRVLFLASRRAFWPNLMNAIIVVYSDL